MAQPCRVSPPSPAEALACDAQEQVALLEAFLVTAHHFFGDWTTIFAPIQDPRAPQLITYPLPSLLFTGMLMFLGRLGARRQVTHLLRRNGAATAQYQALCPRSRMATP